MPMRISQYTAKKAPTVRKYSDSPSMPEVVSSALAAPRFVAFLPLRSGGSTKYSRSSGKAS